MYIRLSILVLSLGLSACASSPTRMSHSDYGEVDAGHEKFISDRDSCIGEFISANNKTSNAVEEQKAARAADFLDMNELAALITVSSGVSSNSKAMRYVESCLKQKGWQQNS